MLIWIALFLLVLAVSFILALKSMKDFAERPSHFRINYSLFLIRRPEALNAEILKELYQKLASKSFILSFEKLFKGPKEALVVYGPTTILQEFSQALDFLELEDYSQKLRENVAAWEVGLKASAQKLEPKGKLFDQMPQLTDGDEFWWQAVVRPTGTVSEGQEPAFWVSIRAALQVIDKNRQQSLESELVKIGHQSNLAALPQAFTSNQLVKFYQERSFPQGKVVALQKENLPLKVSPQDLRFLLGLG